MSVINRNSGSAIFDTFTIALTKNMRVGQVCIVNGQVTSSDGLGAQYEVKANGSGGVQMSNGNELVILDGETLKPESVANIAGLTGTKDNSQISLKGWHPDSDVGGGTLYWDSAALKSTHNGGTIFSPTVPWTTTTADYLNAVGETDGAGTGVWVRVGVTSILQAEWFGYPVGTATTAGYESILQPIIDLAQELDLKLTIPKNSDVRLDGPVTFKQGKSAVDSKSYSVNVDWQGSTLRPNFDGDCITIVPRCLTADIATGRQIGRVDFSNLIFDGYFITLNSYTAARALVIGNGTHRWDSYSKSEVKNIRCSGGFLTAPFHLRNGRNCDFIGIVAREATSGGISIESLSDDEFTGDFGFSDCSLSGKASNPPLKIYGFSATGRPEARGIHFRDCVFYGSGTSIEASTNSLIADIWFENCAWDGPTAPATEDAITISTNGANSLIIQVFFDEPYIVNYTGRALVVTTSTGTGHSISIRGGTIRSFNSTGLDLIDIVGGENFRIDSVDFRNNVCSREIRLFTSFHSLVNNNDSQGSTMNNFILISGTSNDYSILGNVAQTTTVVNDAAAGANKQIANNLSVTT